MAVLPVGDVVPELDVLAVVEPEPGLFEGVSDLVRVWGNIGEEVVAGIFGVFAEGGGGGGEGSDGG